MNFQRITYIVFLTLLPVLFLTSMARARVYLDITSPDFRKVPFAVPYISNKNNPGDTTKADRDLTGLLVKALEFHGFISVTSAEKYGGSM
ncbi:MAG: hypothetical protein R3297_08925, partial [Desulfobulbales bacterium]|nr:hypothetical protein [Desulfobulbales bacterium]